MPKCHSHCTFIIVKVYIVNRIMWTLPPVVVMFTCCFILCRCLRNVWWCVTYTHLLNNALHAYQQIYHWQLVMPPMFEITSCCKKMHHPYKFKEVFNLLLKGVSCVRISRIRDILVVWNIACVDEKCGSGDLIAIFHTFLCYGLTFFIFCKIVCMLTNVRFGLPCMM